MDESQSLKSIEPPDVRMPEWKEGVQHGNNFLGCRMSNPQTSFAWSASQADLMVRHSSSVIVRRQYGEIDAFFLSIPRSDNRCLRTARTSPASPWTNTSTGPGAKSKPATASGSSVTGSSVLPMQIGDVEIARRGEHQFVIGTVDDY